MGWIINGCKFFIASCIPGCGQMYLGYMKRGVSLMTVFSGVLALAVFMEMGALAVLLAPIWLYSFFDGYNLRRRLEGELVENEAEPDAYLFGLPALDGNRLTELLGKRHSVIGWALVLLGAYALWQEVIARIFWNISDELYYFMRWEVPRITVTVFVILLGVWFIRGPRKPEESAPFVPPVIPAEPAPGPFAEPEKAEEETPEGTADGEKEAEHDGQ